MQVGENMLMYHGSDKKSVQKLIQGNIDVAIGGGEIGRGFYLGNMLYVAKAWAMNKHNSMAVLQIEVADNELEKLEPLVLSYEEACEKRSSIRKESKQRTYVFNEDVVWAPIVGTKKIEADQLKWESVCSQNLLNSNKVDRREI